MNTTTLIIVAILLAVLVAIGISIVLRARTMVIEDPSVPVDKLAEFQRMREEGSITEEEYKRLKRVVASQAIEKVKEESDL